MLDGNLQGETFQNLTNRMRALESRAPGSNCAGLKFTLEIDEDKFDEFAGTETEVMTQRFAEIILRYPSRELDRNCWVYVRPSGTG